MKHHYHPDKLISDIHSNVENEVFAEKNLLSAVPDDDRTAKARQDFLACGEVTQMLRLGDALAYQMRYREALIYYEMAKAIKPNDYNVLRRCAVRHMSIMEFDKAREELERCLPITTDLWDTKYKLACVDYYEARYESALQKFTECYPLCEDSGELQIAVIYWQIMCLVKLNKSVDSVLTNFYSDMDVGHHYGYGKAVELFKTGDNGLIGDFPSELCRHIYLYGEAMYYKYIGDEEGFISAFDKAKSLKTYFSSFVYLAILSEKL